MLVCEDFPSVLGVRNVLFENPEGTRVAVFSVAEIAVEFRGYFGETLRRFLAQVFHDFGFEMFADLQAAVQLEKEFALGIECRIALLGVQGFRVQQDFFRKSLAKVFGQYRAHFGFVFDCGVIIAFAFFEMDFDNGYFCTSAREGIVFFDRIDLAAFAHEPALCF